MQMGLGGSTPQVNHGGETAGQKRLFYSLREIALIKDKHVLGGFGVLRAGQVMAVEPISGDLVPYVPTTAPLHMAAAAGRVFLVATIAIGAQIVYVPKGDGYKFKVGQSIILSDDSSGTPVIHDGGAITAIDVTTYPHMDKITFTTVTEAEHGIANFASAYIKTGTSTPFSTAKYILDKDIFTGEGEDALGAETSVVISNAMLYTASLINMDTAAITAMSAVADGMHTILK